MKQKKPAATPATNATGQEAPKLSNTRREDWIDEVALKQMFFMCDSSVRNYLNKGILHSTKWGGRRWFYIPHILRTWEENYR